jgi:phosphonate transport system ATP-binding protein
VNAPPAPAAPAVALRGVAKRYGATLALDGVNLEVGAGEFVALLGPSGAGKSTIFRCVSRLARPDAGEVHVLGARMDRLAGRALREQRRAIGLIFQQFNLIGRMSALDNALAGRLGQVAMWRAVSRRFRDADRQLALAALHRVGLLEKAYQRADSLSGGQQQRVAIARVLAQRSRLILADEPVASLDPAAAANVLETLAGVARERGIAVLCSLHQTDLALHFADRIVAMRAGRILFDRPAAALRADDMEAVYGTAEVADPPAAAPLRIATAA